MATKIGAGGRQQNYDPHTGRYTSTTFLEPCKPTLSKKEKARHKEQLRREELFNRAQNSHDPLVFETYCAIEAALPGHVQHVNIELYDHAISNDREFDIITKKCIIEVKSSKHLTRGGKQFPAQKRYAEVEAHKHYFVFAPNVSRASVAKFFDKGIVVINTYKGLINIIKEYEK